MREPVVLAELDPLGVDQDEPHVLGRRAHQNRRDDRVDARRLARAGGARDEEVRHLGDVHDDRPPGDVTTEADLERMAGPVRLVGGEDVAQRDELARRVRYLDADRRAPRYGRQDADVG